MLINEPTKSLTKKPVVCQIKDHSKVSPCPVLWRVVLSPSLGGNPLHP